MDGPECLLLQYSKGKYLLRRDEKRRVNATPIALTTMSYRDDRFVHVSRRAEQRRKQIVTLSKSNLRDFDWHCLTTLSPDRLYPAGAIRLGRALKVDNHSRSTGSRARSVER
jgi:hypothetical protein